MADQTKGSRSLKEGQALGAQKDLIEQLFDDHYKNRWLIYRVNFIRGIFFGLGSFIGASVVVGLLIGLLSIFTDIPVVGNFFQATQSSIEKQKK